MIFKKVNKFDINYICFMMSEMTSFFVMEWGLGVLN